MYSDMLNELLKSRNERSDSAHNDSAHNDSAHINWRSHTYPTTGSFFGNKRLECEAAKTNGEFGTRPDLQMWEQHIFRVYDELKAILIDRNYYIPHIDSATRNGMSKMFDMIMSTSITAPSEYRRIMSDIYESIGGAGLKTILDIDDLCSIKYSTDLSDLPDLEPDTPLPVHSNLCRVQDTGDQNGQKGQKIPLYRLPKSYDTSKNDVPAYMMNSAPQQNEAVSVTRSVTWTGVRFDDSSSVRLVGETQYTVQMLRCCDGCKKIIDIHADTECHCNNCEGEYDLCAICRKKGLSVDRCPQGYQCGRW